MIYNDTTFNGVLVQRFIDNGDGTGTLTNYDNDGNVISVQNLSGLAIIPDYPPLDATGALATLLVVLGIITLEDGSNAIHEEPEHLIAEAEAWSIATP